MVRKLMYAATAVAAFSMVGLATPNTAEAGWRYGGRPYATGYRGGYGYRGGPVYRGGYYGGYPGGYRSAYRGGFYSPYQARPYYGGGYYAQPYNPGVGLYIGF